MGFATMLVGRLEQIVAFLDALGLEDGADEDGEHHLVILRHTLMNPWLIDRHNGISYIDLYFRHLEQRIAALLPAR